MADLGYLESEYPAQDLMLYFLEFELEEDVEHHPYYLKVDKTEVLLHNQLHRLHFQLSSASYLYECYVFGHRRALPCQLLHQ